MASQVLRGNGSITYTNNTGQNVRVIINYLRKGALSSSSTLTISWGGSTAAQRGSITTTLTEIGKTINSSVPTELMLSAGDTFVVTGFNPTSGSSDPPTAYNIVVIPENG